MKIRIALALLIFNCGSALAYKESTHELIALVAFDQSVLARDDALRETLMGGDGAQDLGSMIGRGAVDEDSGTRPLNHFSDPVNDRPLTVLGVALGEKSPDWALEDTQQFSAQESSLLDAYGSLYRTLSASTSSDRRAALGQMAVQLGHTLHHVADMAQPQHVRNDDHCDQGLLKCVLRDSPSLYESFADDHIKEYVRLPYADWVGFSSSREFWQNARQNGMSQFTAKNFVSARTNFSAGMVDFFTDSEFPKPSPGRTTWIELKDLIPSSALSGKVGFVATNYTDYYDGEAGENPLGSTFSIFAPDLQRYYVPTSTPPQTEHDVRMASAFTLNRFNYGAAMQLLIPRAVAYSSGLINHFFGAGWNPTFPRQTALT